MEFYTHAKKCVSRNNYELLGRVAHEMHLALKRETGALGRGRGAEKLSIMISTFQRRAMADSSQRIAD